MPLTSRDAEQRTPHQQYKEKLASAEVKMVISIFMYLSQHHNPKHHMYIDVKKKNIEVGHSFIAFVPLIPTQRSTTINAVQPANLDCYIHASYFHVHEINMCNWMASLYPAVWDFPLQFAYE